MSITSNSLSQLCKDITACTRCPLRETATNPVPGAGPIGAKYMLIGEAPGRDEDHSGMPFVGAAGRKLDKLMALAGININDCYVTNVCRCRPPDNRKPRKGEVRACNEFLMREIEIVKPEIFITLGSTPLTLVTELGIRQLHGTKIKWLDRDVICQYHPAAALHNPRLWADILADWEHLPDSVDHSFVVSKYNKIPTVASLDTENDNAGKLGTWSMAYREDDVLKVADFTGPRRDVHLPETVIMHNARWDLRVLDRAGMKRPKNVIDTMIMAYCLHPSTRVLTRDLRWVKLEALRVGDQLVGIDEYLPEAKLKKGRRLMKPSTILALSRRLANCYEVIFDNNVKVICSEEHPWLTQRKGSNAGNWRRTDKLRKGWRMVAPLVTWDFDMSYEGGYASGLLDGEGDINKFSLNFSQNDGPILEWMKAYFELRKIRYTITLNKSCKRLHVWGLNNVLSLLGITRPIRLLGKETWIGRTPSRQTNPIIRIKSITPVGEQEVISIETSTHTFNAEGFWTHNCLGLGKADSHDSANNRSGANMVGGLGLKYLARRHLGMEMKTWKQVKDHPEMMREYNAEDSVSTFLLYEKWKDDMPDHFWNIDMPLLDVLMTMEDRGILVDPEFLKTYSASLDDELTKFDLPVNVHAPQEIQAYIYGHLGIEPWRFTDNGAPSTDNEVLESIDDPVIKQVIEYKQIYQERETYAGGYFKALGADGRIHAEFKQTSTTTGRLSCANPNLQNVVKRRGELRKLFIVPPGYKMIRIDWKLGEFGMLAVLAGDDDLINAFLHGDVHQETANGLGIDRDTGKHINFLMQNGGSAWGISQTYGIPIDLAKEYYNKYFRRFPALKRFGDETVEKALATHYAEGPFGRKHRVDALFAGDWRIKQEGIREAKTMPMQNGLAEMVKIAMIDLHRQNAPMLIQVHDELLFEIPDDMAVEYAHWLKEYVPTITEIKGVQFPVEVSIGNNWLECLKKENVI